MIKKLVHLGLYGLAYLVQPPGYLERIQKDKTNQEYILYKFYHGRNILDANSNRGHYNFHNSHEYARLATRKVMDLEFLCLHKSLY